MKRAVSLTVTAPVDVVLRYEETAPGVWEFDAVEQILAFGEGVIESHLTAENQADIDRQLSSHSTTVVAKKPKRTGRK
jgi:hypothetical protein